MPDKEIANGKSKELAKLEKNGGKQFDHSCYGWKWHFLAKKHYTI